ncbi:MAG: F0F1 ATP synthase subunit delta [Gammaproteobacteria bacterium]|nr:F0F1 ATP synthase subunit delta [Gammaproteobacteria bacterium]MCH9745022.1 F0F1 ATP synthase subunit delta [Gammaproteobacteria bacterium]
MANNFTAARPYARAIFADACESQQLQPWLAVLQGMVVITEVLSAQHLIDNPGITDTQLESLCFEVAQEAMSEQVALIGQHLQNLIQLLVREKRLAITGDIAILYQQLLREHEDIIEIDVTSAFKLTDAQRETISTALKKRFAQAVKVDYKEDQALIGGAIIRAGNWVMDGSVKGSLNRLADSLEGTL